MSTSTLAFLIPAAVELLRPSSKGLLLALTSTAWMLCLATPGSTLMPLLMAAVFTAMVGAAEALSGGRGGAGAPSAALWASAVAAAGVSRAAGTARVAGAAAVAALAVLSALSDWGPLDARPAAPRAPPRAPAPPRDVTLPTGEAAGRGAMAVVPARPWDEVTAARRGGSLPAPPPDEELDQCFPGCLLPHARRRLKRGASVGVPPAPGPDAPVASAENGVATQGSLERDGSPAASAAASTAAGLGKGHSAGIEGRARANGEAGPAPRGWAWGGVLAGAVVGADGAAGLALRVPLLARWVGGVASGLTGTDLRAAGRGAKGDGRGGRRKVAPAVWSGGLFTGLCMVLSLCALGAFMTVRAAGVALPSWADRAEDRLLRVHVVGFAAWALVAHLRAQQAWNALG